MKTQITVRVSEEALKKLAFKARKLGMNRQNFIEKILTEYCAEINLEKSTKTVSYVSKAILDLIRENILKLKLGSEISLKDLVGKEEWGKLDDPTRRNFGKEFFRGVDNREFSHLKSGRKKSNNEQQYLSC